MLRRSTLYLLAVLAGLTGAAYLLFSQTRPAWRLDVEFGDTEAYYRAFDANYGIYAQAYEWSLGALLVITCFAGLLLLRGVRSWKDFRALRTRSRLRLHAVASVAALAYGVGMIQQMTHDMAMWRPPPWADSPGIVIFGAAVATPMLLLIFNALLGLHVLGGQFPNPLWSRADRGFDRFRSLIGWVGAAACALLALMSIANSEPYLAPSFVIGGYAILLARGAVAGRVASEAAV